MFSYAVLNDDRQHAIELLLDGKNLTMRVDGGLARSLINLGSKVSDSDTNAFNHYSVLQEVLSVASPTYLGGLPDRVGIVIIVYFGTQCLCHIHQPEPNDDQVGESALAQCFFIMCQFKSLVIVDSIPHH